MPAAYWIYSENTDKTDGTFTNIDAVCAFRDLRDIEPASGAGSDNSGTWSQPRLEVMVPNHTPDRVLTHVVDPSQWESTIFALEHRPHFFRLGSYFVNRHLLVNIHVYGGRARCIGDFVGGILLELHDVTLEQIKAALSLPAPV
jgi:hypothetical protein